MAACEACISLLVVAGTVLVTTCCRQLTRRQFALRNPGAQCFFLELTGAFQICACTHELLLLASLPPGLHVAVALALVYVCTALHALTLPDSVNNPASSFYLLFKGSIVVRTGWLQMSAQFTGAVLAIVYMKLIWLLGMMPVHSRRLLVENCSSPLQTTLVHAFFLELLFSFLFHLVLLQFESLSPRIKVHLAALLITTLVYEGGHLTGAIFNPALALSLHMSCFMDKFWNYMPVYWIAPCLGSALVVLLWDEILPRMRTRV